MTTFYDRASNVVRKIYERRIDAPAVMNTEREAASRSRERIYGRLHE